MVQSAYQQYCTHTPLPRTVRIHCAHTLYAYTVRIHCALCSYTFSPGAVAFMVHRPVDETTGPLAQVSEWGRRGGVEWGGVAWSGVGWSGVKWSGVEWMLC
jgi:hypothetical protein